MAGETEWDSTVILQKTTDLQVGSNECLILVDVCIHVDSAGTVPTSPSINRKVIRIPHQVARLHMLRYTMTEAFCRSQGDRCIVKHNGNLWPQQDVALRLIAHGDYMQIHLPPPSDEYVDISLRELFDITFQREIARQQGAHGWTFDAFSLLQHSPRPAVVQQQNPDLDGQLRTCGLHCLMTLQDLLHEEGTQDETSMMQTPQAPNQIAVDVLRQRLDDMPFFTQMLHVAWDQAAVQICGEHERHADVMTWFIDFHTHPQCTQPRAVTLYENFQEWETQIERAWIDLIDPTEPVDIYHVMPVPPDCQAPTCAHIIVCQRAHVYKRAVMVTTYTVHHEITRTVGLVDAATTEWDIQLAANVGHACTSGHLRDRCTCFFGTTSFTPSTTWTTHNGMHFYILIDAESVYPPDDDDVHDFHSLWQFPVRGIERSQDDSFESDVTFSDACSLMQGRSVLLDAEQLARQPAFIQELHTRLYFYTFPF